MVFSSLVFLCIFLPVVFLLDRILPGIKARNMLLLFASLLFYAYGEPVYVLLMIGAAFLNYLWALLMEQYPKYRKLFLWISVVENLGILGVFKYAGFLVESFNNCIGFDLPVPELALPIGISFFTFQAMSYVLDVYRGEGKAQHNFAVILLYISFFPQLIAGPIVKYHDIEQELSERRCNADAIAGGIRRFIVGLSKKILISNYMGVVTDTLFAAQASHINVLGAWMGAAAYMLQIYFDFSGYSDMAIGLGWMFGFHFKENFHYPYVATSVRDFWKRWHISLSGWFKEYLYIPLGGNRKGRARTSLNKMIVFVCTGIWHGANVTFLFWGLYHGFFLMLEEYIPFIRRQGGRIKKAMAHLYTLLVVLIGFVFFRAETISQGLFWVKEMFAGFHFETDAKILCMSLLTPIHLLALGAGIIGSMPLKEKLEKKRGWQMISWLISPLLLLLCILNLAGGTYNPFIYFRF